MFTMEEDAEEQDDCFKVYRKSLLVSGLACLRGLQAAADPRPAQVDQEGPRPACPVRRERRRLVDRRPAPRSCTSRSPKASRRIRSRVRSRTARSTTIPRPCRRCCAASSVSTTTPASAKRTFRFRHCRVPSSFTFRRSPAASRRRYNTCPPSTPSSPAPGPAGQRIKALCIGINEYPERPLAGCVSDARAWGRALGEIGAQVDYLIDGDATYEGMKAAIRTLVSSGKRRRRRSCSSTRPRRPAAESGRFGGGRLQRSIDSNRLRVRLAAVDDELAEILGELPAGVSMTLFMDCCHSGTNSRFAPVMRARAAAGDRPRFMPLDDDIVDAYFSRGGARCAQARRRRVAAPHRPFRRVPGSRVRVGVERAGRLHGGGGAGAAERSR